MKAPTGAADAANPQSKKLFKGPGHRALAAAAGVGLALAVALPPAANAEVVVKWEGANWLIRAVQTTFEQAKDYLATQPWWDIAGVGNAENAKKFAELTSQAILNQATFAITKEEFDRARLKGADAVKNLFPMISKVDAQRAIESGVMPPQVKVDSLLYAYTFQDPQLLGVSLNGNGELAPPMDFSGSASETFSFAFATRMAESATVVEPATAAELAAAPSDTGLDGSVVPVDFIPAVPVASVDTNGTASVPGPLAILGVGAAFAYSRKLRQRINAAKQSPN
jgi:hypothetical protein